MSYLNGTVHEIVGYFVQHPDIPEAKQCLKKLREYVRRDAKNIAILPLRHRISWLRIESLLLDFYSIGNGTEPQQLLPQWSQEQIAACEKAIVDICNVAVDKTVARVCEMNRNDDKNKKFFSTFRKAMEEFQDNGGNARGVINELIDERCQRFDSDSLVQLHYDLCRREQQKANS